MKYSLESDCSKPLLLFDLGGVLVEWTGVQSLAELSGKALASEDVRQFWLCSPWVRRFEVGECSAQEFARGVIAELNLPLGPDDFLRRFLAWDRGPFPGTADVLGELSEASELASLSNNNELHWPRLRDRTEIGPYFRHCYVSHEIGLIKPDKEVFEYVLRDLGRPAHSIVFFDDNPECVEAAAALGFDAHCVQGLDQLRRKLMQLGLLPPPG